MGYTYWKLCETCHKSYDGNLNADDCPYCEHTKLRAELEQVKKDMDGWHGQAFDLNKDVGELTARAEQAERERDEYADKLRRWLHDPRDKQLEDLRLERDNAIIKALAKEKSLKDTQRINDRLLEQMKKNLAAANKEIAELKETNLNNVACCEMQVNDLQKEIALRDKALELACKNMVCWDASIDKYRGVAIEELLAQAKREVEGKP